MVKQLIQLISKIWLTGLLLILALVGYAFYIFMWLFRFMQKSVKVFLVWIAVLVVSTVIVVGILFMPFRTGEAVELIIQPGSSLNTVAGELKHRNVIHSSRALILWMKLNGTDRQIKAGKCTFHEREGILSAAEKLLNSSPIEISVTVPEGLTIEQTARRIATVFPIDTVDFINSCYDSTFARNQGIPEPSLEGYLFPETYQFREKVTVSEIITRMVTQFHATYHKLQIDTTISEQYTRHQLVTLASIIEKEATVPSERPRISGVFHRRLILGMPLGADPTVRYAIHKFTGPLRVSELNNPSPYNTRRFAGLPPGPICSPGLKSLEAAVSPMDTKELYFVAKEDGTGEHDFSFTNREHVRKKEEIARRRKLKRK